MEERLYIDLMMDHMPEDCEAKTLIAKGYLTLNMQYTEKAISFIDSFITNRKDAVYEAIRELGPDTRKSYIMKKADITQLGVLSDVVNALIKEGKLRKENGKLFII